MKALWRAGGLLVLLVGVARVEGSGMLFPKDESLPALAIKHQRVDIRIKDGTAAVTVEQVFRNSTGRDLEAEYVFPLPEKASIADLAMYIGVKRMSGATGREGQRAADLPGHCATREGPGSAGAPVRQPVPPLIELRRPRERRRGVGEGPR